ncbi:MAG: hypothetical protein ACKV2T_13120 [Kofleriaceae bacterium]
MVHITQSRDDVASPERSDRGRAQGSGGNDMDLRCTDRWSYGRTRHV